MAKAPVHKRHSRLVFMLAGGLATTATLTSKRPERSCITALVGELAGAEAALHCQHLPRLRPVCHQGPG